MAPGAADRQGDSATVTHAACRPWSQTQSQVWAHVGQGGGPDAQTKACLPGQEDASSRPARPRGIHPWTHNGQPVPGHLILPAPPWAWCRGQGERRGEGALRSLCPWRGPTHVHGLGVSQDGVGRATGQRSVRAGWWPKAVHLLTPETDYVTFVAKGDSAGQAPAPKMGRAPSCSGPD